MEKSRIATRRVDGLEKFKLYLKNTWRKRIYCEYARTLIVQYNEHIEIFAWHWKTRNINILKIYGIAHDTQIVAHGPPHLA